jgi:hypothetical protein
MAPIAQQPPPPPLSGSAERALRRLAQTSGAAALRPLRAEGLLMERARLLGLTFADRTAPGGACRLLETADGELAVNLPRDSDWELLPAWLESDAADPFGWSALAAAVRHKPTNVLVERARLLGLAVAPAAEPAAAPSPFLRSLGAPLPDAVPAAAKPARPPRVVDLSSLWAGPLCSHLLQLCGAEVIKVESRERPDGARQGNREFFDLRNQGKSSVVLDFRSADGRAMLQRLIESADIVIEASRPRALLQLGIDAEALLRRRSGLTWISLTGYGRDQPQGNWIAFGDDAGVAAGLAAVMRAATGTAQFAGDAIADPLTGIHAALAGWSSWQSGGGRLLALALADVAAASLAEEAAAGGWDTVHRDFAGWWAAVRGRRLEPHGERRPCHAPAPQLGADSDAVLGALDTPC